jgi:hypothetical protein
MGARRYKAAMLAFYAGVVATIGGILWLSARWVLHNIGHPSVWTWTKVCLEILGLALLGRICLGWGTHMRREYDRRRDGAAQSQSIS